PGRAGGRRGERQRRRARAEAVSPGARPHAHRRAALPHRQPDRLAVQPTDPDARRGRVRVPGPAGAALTRAGVRDPGWPAARSRAVRLLPVLPLRQRRKRGRRSAHRGPAGGRGPRPQGAVGIHHAQAQGRCVPAALRAGVLPRAGRGVAGRQPALRSQRRLVNGASHLVRAADRGLEQRLPRRPGLRVARDAPDPRADPDAAGHQHRGRRVRAAGRQRAADRGGRDPPRHDVLGRDSPLHQGGRHLRGVPVRRGRPLVGRAGHPVGDHAALGRRPAEPDLRRGRTLPSPRGRCDRGRETGVLPRRDGGADCPGARRDAGPRARGPLPRGVSAARHIRVRPGSAAPWLDTADPQLALGRSRRRARAARARLRPARACARPRCSHLAYRGLSWSWQACPGCSAPPVSTTATTCGCATARSRTPPASPSTAPPSRSWSWRPTRRRCEPLGMSWSPGCAACWGGTSGWRAPRLALRLLDHWDNLNGTVERGYARASLWEWARLPDSINPRYRDYARANASIGINGVVLTNVNANALILTPAYLGKVAALARVFRPWGLKVYLTARFSAPLEIGGLATADPLDSGVRAWWAAKADEIYRAIPDFGGFLVKANSEGQPGPQDYHRTHADGANLLADAVAPHGGIVMWRAFVYSSAVPTDRVMQAGDEFVPLDGAFRSNVLIQVKNGPL